MRGIERAKICFLDLFFALLFDKNLLKKILVLHNSIALSLTADNDKHCCFYYI